MYNPALYAHKDRAALPELYAFLEQYPFATLVTRCDGELDTNHIPLLASPDRAVLEGHVARANPVWRELALGEPVLAVFHGPQGYVSPSWYVDPQNVPTWNYAVVQVRGRARLLESEASTLQVLSRAVEFFERKVDPPWRLELPREFVAELTRAIVAFEISIESIEGKFKLGQNRTPEDRRGAIAGLERAGAHELARLMSAMSSSGE